MSLLFFDGFDSYAAISDLTNYGGWSQVNALSVNTNTRTGTGKSLWLNSSSTWWAAKDFPDQAGKTLYIGLAFSHPNIGIGASVFSLISAGGFQISCTLNTSNKMELRRGGYNGTLLTTGTTTLIANSWYYIEAKILVHPTAGIAELRINNAVDGTFTGNTQAQTNNSVTRVYLFDPTNSGTVGFIDDFYILNSDGTANNTYLGEQRCVIMNPTTDNSIAWSRNTGTTNVSAVNQTAAGGDGDTTYVYSSTPGQKDMYGYAGLTGMAAVAAVKVVTRAEKDDVNPLSLKTGIRSGAVDQQNINVLPQGYANFIDLWETSDGAGTAWTSTTVNSLLSTIQIP